MARYVGFMWYTCPACNHSKTWPWNNHPWDELGNKCEECGASIEWKESCVPDR